MFHLFKLLFLLLRGLIYENKDEMDIKSQKFNTRKFIALILLMLSIITNGWLIYRFFTVASEHLALKEQVQVSCPQVLDPPTKKP